MSSPLNDHYDHYSTLVLSGGSVKCIAMLGTVQYGYDNQLFQRITTFIGTSAGGIICYLLCIGYTPIEIIMYMCSHSILKKNQYIDIVSMMNGTGALDFSLLSIHLEKMTIEKIGRLVTFKDIRDLFAKRLVVNTYNITRDCIEYLSVETTPDLPCLSALRQTCSLPFIFEPYKYMGEYYIDGGIYENFAVNYQVDKDASKRIGICIDALALQEMKTDPYNTMEYMYHLLTIPIRQNLQHVLVNIPSIDIIRVQPSIGMFQLQLTSHELLELFSSGYQQAKTFFSSGKG
jgi:predicted acylesterase/phospholipase RssA